MLRRRALATVLACLAVLAGALNMAVAAPVAISAGQSAMGAPCTDCDDCDKVPCPMPLADCIQMHANPGPALLAAPLDLAAGASVAVQWSATHTTLSGLSPPPDPLPPRT